jgi:hypothetical protein
MRKLRKNESGTSSTTNTNSSGDDYSRVVLPLEIAISSPYTTSTSSSHTYKSSKGSSSTSGGNRIRNPQKSRPRRNLFQCLVFFLILWVLLMIGILVVLHRNTTTTEIGQSTNTSSFKTNGTTAARSMSNFSSMSSAVIQQDRVAAIATMRASTTSTAPKCTERQMSAIRQQLNPGHIGCLDKPWRRECPITAATRCYNQSAWLFNYHFNRQMMVVDGGNTNPFLALTLGCNGGYDAVHLLRLGTLDPSVNVSAWSYVSVSTLQQGKLVDSTSCGPPEDVTYVPPSTISNSSSHRKGQVYCVESDNATVDAIQRTNQLISYDWKGLHVIYNPPLSSDKDSLDHLVQKQRMLWNNDTVIHVLQIENGYEFEVMAWGMQTLKRTEYLIYKYDWKGSWSLYGRTVEATVGRLDTIGFTCYWAGRNKLWRITSCFYQEYDERGKYWSHIACANRFLAPTLVNEMEALFERTIRSD